MKGRGESARREAKLDILRILTERVSNVAELSAATDTGRATVSELLSELIDYGIVERIGERAFSLSGRICFVLMELYFDRAEIFTYSFDVKCVARKALRFVASMSFDGNVARVISIVERHIDALAESGYAVHSATMLVACDTEIAPPSSLALKLKKKDALVKYLEMSGVRESLLYLDVSGACSYFCFDGKYVRGKALNVENIASGLDSAFSVFAPEMLMVEGSDASHLAQFKTTCERSSVCIIPIDRKTPTPAERGMILNLFEKML